ASVAAAFGGIVEPGIVASAFEELAVKPEEVEYAFEKSAVGPRVVA
ncbi:9820_t:CDS:1, partial [Cetraspora pellucida]